MRMTEYILWASIALCVYTYFGYPVVIHVLCSLFKKKIDKGRMEPQVSFVFAGYNEEKAIGKKIENILGLDYPNEKFEIIFASDGSTDGTVKIARSFADRGVVVVECPRRRGKVSALNDAVAKATGEVIVFSDARQIFAKDAIRSLVSNFNDPGVGAVSGELIIASGEKDPVSSVMTYWNYEKAVRRREGEFDSVIGVTGAIWAIRKELFEPFPPDTILDDLYLPLKVLLGGRRVVFESGARAYDIASKNSTQEVKRKVRTIAGNWQVFFRLKGLFNPFRNRAVVQFVSHKVLRVLVPFFLVATFLSNLYLSAEPFYSFLFRGQVLFYALCLASLFICRFKWFSGFFKLFHAFSILNYSAFIGFFKYISNTQEVIWKR